METIPLPLFLPPGICTCKRLDFSFDMEITQMVIIQRKTFAFCKNASSLGKLWLDFCMAFLSPVTCWLRKLKRVSPFPGKQSRDQVLGLGGPGVCDSYPAAVSKGKGGRSWGHRHILIFLVLCFTVFTSVLFEANMSRKIAVTSVSNRTTCFGVTFSLLLHHFLISLFYYSAREI